MQKIQRWSIFLWNPPHSQPKATWGASYSALLNICKYPSKGSFLAVGFFPTKLGSPSTLDLNLSCLTVQHVQPFTSSEQINFIPLNSCLTPQPWINDNLCLLSVNKYPSGFRYAGYGRHKTGTNNFLTTSLHTASSRFYRRDFQRKSKVIMVFDFKRLTAW